MRALQEVINASFSENFDPQVYIVQGVHSLDLENVVLISWYLLISLKLWKRLDFCVFLVKERGNVSLHSNLWISSMLLLQVKYFRSFKLHFSDFTLKYLIYSQFRCLLKVQWCKLYNNKYMIASTQITNRLSRNVLFINRKDNRNC